MQDLQQAVANSFAKIVGSGAIETMIEKKLQDSIKSIVDDVLGNYSDFGKSVKEAVKGALGFDATKLSIDSYNDLILKVIQQQVEMHTNNSIAKHVQETITDLLQPAPTEIKLSKLIQDYIESKNHDACSCDSRDYITLHIDKSEGLTAGYTHIWMDHESRVAKYSCALQIDVDPDGKVYSIKINRNDPKNSLFFGPVYGFERDLYQMYAAGTKLIIDGDGSDDFDIYYPGND